MSLNRQITTGIIWSSIQLIIQQSFSFIVKLVLARLLFPDDFGLVGMAVVFTSFVQVFNDLGIGAALIQRKEEDLNSKHFHTSFWTGIIWSILLYTVIVLVVAPIAADFYSEPLLQKIIPILSIGVLASPINLVHKAQLTKAMNFKKIAIISNSCNIFSGLLSISLAFIGMGVWALVFNSVASIVIAIPLYFKATGWKPKLVWGKREFKDIFGFGMYTTGTSVFNNLISKIDYLLIGKLMSASALGYYTFAFMLTDILRSQLMGVMNKVMYPVYGQKQDDPKSLKNYYLKVVRYNSLIVYPIMNVILFAGEPLIKIFFGNKWSESIVPLQILAVSVMFHMMVSSNTALIRGLGKPKLELQLQLFKAIILYTPLIYAGIYFYGLKGAALAILVTKALSVVIAQYYLKKLVNISIGDLYNSIKEPLIATILTMLICQILIYFKLHFIFIILCVTAIFSLVYWVMMKQEIFSSYQLIKNYKK